MATPILNKVSKDLAYRLQDPVSAGSVDGARLTAAERLNYIARGYRRLLRFVDRVFPNLCPTLFERTLESIAGTTSPSGTIDISNYPKVFELYVKEQSSELYFKAIEVHPYNWESVKAGTNQLFKPDLNKNQVYWVEMNKTIYLTPPTTYIYRMLVRPDVINLVESTGYNGANDIDIKGENIDLLSTYAAAEAYSDIGETNKAQLLRQEVIDQLTVITQGEQTKERTDEN